jgi:beta-lactamase regulating signal transducer with metallopeptidase domain
MNWPTISPSSLCLWLLAVTLKVTILLSLSWIVAIGLRSNSSARRHCVWFAGILAALVLPLLIALIPMRYARFVGGSAVQRIFRADVSSGIGASTGPINTIAKAHPTMPHDFVYFVALVWVIGSLVLALRVLAGLAQLARISKHSRPLPNEEWAHLGTQLSGSYEIKRHVRILEFTGNSVPITWGALRPCVLIPSAAAQWLHNRRRIVLAHEFAHISRHDWLLQMCAELVCCLYWFHPLAWLAARKLRQESERACDDAVLRSGVRASDYAGELLDLVESLGISRRRWSPALAIVRQSDLERRFAAMFSPSINRSGMSWRANLVVSAVSLCLLISLAAIRLPAQNHNPNSDATAPGWFLAGDHPQNYVTGVDRNMMYLGRPSAYSKSKPSATGGFGTLMQQFNAAEYAGKRVRLSAWVKSEDLNDWAGLWMRVDSGAESVAFDNMQNRAIRGTTGWQNYAVVLDVPKDATRVSFGILVSKSGSVWLNSVQFETVGKDVPVTNMWADGGSLQQRPGPTNLNFEEE